MSEHDNGRKNNGGSGFKKFFKDAPKQDPRKEKTYDPARDGKITSWKGDEGGKISDDKKPWNKDDAERKPFGDQNARKTFGKKPWEKDGGERKPYGDRSEGKSFGKKPWEKDGGERKPYGDRSEGKSFGKKPWEKDGGERKPYGDRDSKPYEKKSWGNNEGGARKPYGDRSEAKTFGKKTWEKDGGERQPYGDRDSKPYEKKSWGNNEGGARKPYGDRSEEKPFGKKPLEKDGSERKEGKPFGKKPWEKDGGERRPYGDKGEGNAYPKKTWEKDGVRKSYGPKGEGRPFPKKSWEKDGERKPYGERGEGKPYPKKTWDKDSGERKPYGERTEGKSFEKKTWKKDDGERTSYGDRDEKKSLNQKPFEKKDDKPYSPFNEAFHEPRPPKPPDEVTFTKELDKWEQKKTNKYEERGEREERSHRENDDRRRDKPEFADKFKPFEKKERAYHSDVRTRDSEKEKYESWYRDDIVAQRDQDPNEKMPLNKYLAHSGVTSRRDAADQIREGHVMVNGSIENNPGYKVQDGDEIAFKGNKISIQVDLVYLLMNKPKGFITTTDDPKGRRTVMQLVSEHFEQRLYPVGRLDRNTTGLLLLTNDGDLAQQLSHPKYQIKKVYQIQLDKDLEKDHYDQIVAGLELEDGIVKPDQLAYLDKPSELGIEIHSGKNRIVRRIFEHFGYQVERLDRVMYAGLTKKNILRGKWRTLTHQEVINLKYMK